MKSPEPFFTEIGGTSHAAVAIACPYHDQPTVVTHRPIPPSPPLTPAPAPPECRPSDGPTMGLPARQGRPAGRTRNDHPAEHGPSRPARSISRPTYSDHECA